MKKISEYNYEVGYGKPPIHSQFQKGSSGNPKGRPKVQLDQELHVLREFDSPIFINENGARRRVSKYQALMKQLVNKALTGDPASLRISLKLLQEAQAKAALVSDARKVELNSSVKSLSDEEMMLRLCESLAKSPGAKIPENLEMIEKFYKGLLE